MKKILCVVLVTSIILSVFSMGTHAYNPSFQIKENFESSVHGASSVQGASVAGSVVVKSSSDGTNKALELSDTSGENDISWSFDANKGILSLSADFEYKDAWSYTEFYISNVAGKRALLAYIKESGQLYTGDNHIVTGIALNRTVNIQLTYNCKRKKLSVYIDGKKHISGRYMGSSAPEDASALGVKVSAKDGTSCMADNFVIFEGDRIYNPKPVYKSYEYISAGLIGTVTDSDENEEFISDTVYVNRIFGEDGVPEFDKLSITPATNKIQTEKSIFDSNVFVKLTKTQPAESHVGFAGSPTERYHVIECSFSTESNTPSGRLLFVRDGNAESMFETFLGVKANGDVHTSYGDVVAKIKPLEWTDIGLIVDVQNHVFDVYVNKELKAEKVAFKNKTITGLPLIRTGCDNSSSTGTLLIDNIKSYGGKALREIEAQKYGPITEQNDVPINYLGNKKAVQPYSDTMYTELGKVNSAKDIILENEGSVIYAYSEDIKALFGKDVNLSGAHRNLEGYYNIIETASVNGYYMQNMDTRLFVFDKQQPKLTDTQLQSIQRYMFYVRPTAQDLRTLFANTSANKHPRILMNGEKLEEIKSLVKTDLYMKKWSENVIAEATSWFGRDVANYQELLDNVDPAVTNLAMAYHLTGDDRYAARAWKFIEKLCMLENWNPDHYLTTGEFTYVAGLGYDWLFNWLKPEQRKFIEENLLEKGVGYTHKLYFNQIQDGVDGYLGWWQAESNWNAVCNGGSICGAIALMDVYPEICSELIENATKGLEGMITLYYPHGTYEEGLSYWAYAHTFLTHATISMNNAFGDDFNFDDAPGLDKTGWYVINLTGSTTVMTMGDVDSKLLNNPHIMYSADRYNDKYLMAARLNEMEKLGYKGGVFDMIYYNPELLGEEIELSLDTFMNGAEVISLRERWYDKGATYLGASGGNNYRAHGHMDIGSYVVDMAGERFIMDPGAENYSAPGGYFTRNRYYFYRSRPEGHNLYIINPENTLEYYGMGKEADATGELLVSKPKGGIGVMDLSEAYEEWATSAKRGYMLTDDRRSVVVRDEIELKNPDSEVRWGIHTKADVEFVSENQALLTLNGKKLLVTVDTNAAEWKFAEGVPQTLADITKTVVTEADNVKAGIKKLELVAKASGRLNISVKYKLWDDDFIDSNPPKLNISEWTIPDGEVVEIPVLDAIYVNGEAIDKFNPTVTGYKKLVATRITEVPTVSAVSNCKVEVTQAKDFGDDAIIKVYAPGNDSIYRTYRVTLYKLPALEDIDGMRRYPVAEVTASDVPQEENGPANVIDNSIDTRWAAEGVDGHWILLELDDVYPIEKVGTSWMSGNARNYKFKLEISTDGNVWTEVFNGASSGTTNEVEYVLANGAKAKYVRLTAYGNSANNWNSLTEFVVLGNQR